MSYLVPFELLLLSYVVLGPAHYATEISWLHDRKYFLPHVGVAVFLALVAIAAALIADASWFGFVMWAAFVVCAMLAATTTALQSMLVLMVAIALTAIMLSNGLSIAVLGILLPTLIHVSLFTLVFMTLGAYRSEEKVQWLLVALYVGAIATILIAPPSAVTLIPSFAKAAHDYFANVAPALGRFLGTRNLQLDTRLTSLLAFIYTYHYLNWFIKAEVIRWNNMSRGRLAVVAAASIASTALYFYDYSFGFTVLLAFSLAHIVLEFPLCGSSAPPSGRGAQGGSGRIARGSHPLFPGAGEGARHIPYWLLTPCQIVTSPRLRAAVPAPDSGFTFKQLCPS